MKHELNKADTSATRPSDSFSQMTTTEYEAISMRTRGSFDDPERQMTLASLGLTGEAGEVANIVEKVWYHGHAFNQKHMVEELGDCLWYLTCMCDAIGVTLADVMEANVAKLAKRYPNGWTSDASVARVDQQEIAEPETIIAYDELAEYSEQQFKQFWERLKGGPVTPTPPMYRATSYPPNSLRDGVTVPFLKDNSAFARYLQGLAAPLENEHEGGES